MGKRNKSLLVEGKSRASIDFEAWLSELVVKKKISKPPKKILHLTPSVIVI